VLRNFSGDDFVNARVMLDYGESFDKSIRNEETKRMLFFSRSKLPIEKIFTWDDAKQPWNPEQQRENIGIPMYYTLFNTKEKGLGENALWGGKARVYQADGHGSTILLGEDTPPLVPVGEKFKLYIGASRDIVVTQKKIKEERVPTRRNHHGGITLSDTNEITEAKVELKRHLKHQYFNFKTGKGEHGRFEKEDLDTVKFTLELKPYGRQTFTYQVRYFEGERRNPR